MRWLSVIALACSLPAAAQEIDVPGTTFGTHSLVSLERQADGDLLIVTEWRNGDFVVWTARLVDCAGQRVAPFAGGRDREAFLRDVEDTNLDEVEFVPITDDPGDFMDRGIAHYACEKARTE